ncbi:hypothetical protein K2Z84_32085 [Candidatus Binatia bacterium]|nr:hypothetical protein [Candidatus Binatia bacterium]
MNGETLLRRDTIKTPLRFLSEYRFWLGELSTVIRIRLFQEMGTERVHFEQSHFIHAPTQAGPYMTSRPWNDNEDAALNQAVMFFEMHYHEAVEKGHIPDESWLVANDAFS